MPHAGRPRAHPRALRAGFTAIGFARQLCGETHLYGFGNGSCESQCYHFYDCGANGNAKNNQSLFLRDPRSSGGYHNFSAQAQVLLDMESAGQVVAHWGNCGRSLGGAPDAFVSVAKPPRRGRRGQAPKRGRGGTGRGGTGRGRQQKKRPRPRRGAAKNAAGADPLGRSP